MTSAESTADADDSSVVPALFMPDEVLFLLGVSRKDQPGFIEEMGGGPSARSTKRANKGEVQSRESTLEALENGLREAFRVFFLKLDVVPEEERVKAIVSSEQFGPSRRLGEHISRFANSPLNEVESLPDRQDSEPDNVSVMRRRIRVNLCILAGFEAATEWPNPECSSSFIGLFPDYEEGKKTPRMPLWWWFNGFKAQAPKWAIDPDAARENKDTPMSIFQLLEYTKRFHDPKEAAENITKAQERFEDPRKPHRDRLSLSRIALELDINSNLASRWVNAKSHNELPKWTSIRDLANTLYEIGGKQIRRVMRERVQELMVARILNGICVAALNAGMTMEEVMEFRSNYKRDIGAWYRFFKTDPTEESDHQGPLFQIGLSG